MTQFKASAGLAMILVVCLLAAATTGCSRDSKANAKANDPQGHMEEMGDPNFVTIAHPEQFPLVEVELRKLADELHMNGVVSPDVNRSVPVLSLSGGRVVETRVRLGDDVKKGQVLLLISSPDLGSAFSDYQKFAADEVLVRRQLERAQLLYSKGAVAEKDLDVAQDAEAKAKVDLTTAAERLRILGADPAHPSPILEVKAPISGTIVEQNVAGGTGVRSLDNSPSLFTIADMSHVWVLCDVYEDMLSRVNLGDIAEIRLNAYPDLVYEGRVSNITRVLDPATRTAKVRIELDNRHGIMRAGMFVSASFRSRQQKTRLVIPTSAILRLHDKDWVFRPLGENRFRKLEVRMGLTLPDGKQEVVSGLQLGDKIVSNALQFSNASEVQQ